MFVLRQTARLPPIAVKLEAKAQTALDYSYEGAVVVDYGVQPKGWITALNGESGRVLWKIPDRRASAGGSDVPTKGGILFAGDVRGNLFAFDARDGAVLNRIDTGGALNNGLISYAVDGRRYVAAAVGGSRWMAPESAGR